MTGNTYLAGVVDVYDFLVYLHGILHFLVDINAYSFLTLKKQFTPPINVPGT